MNRIFLLSSWLQRREDSGLHDWREDDALSASGLWALPQEPRHAVACLNHHALSRTVICFISGSVLIWISSWIGIRIRIGNSDTEPVGWNKFSFSTSYSICNIAFYLHACFKEIFPTYFLVILLLFLNIDVSKKEDGKKPEKVEVLVWLPRWNPYPDLHSNQFQSRFLYAIDNKTTIIVLTNNSH